MKLDKDTRTMLKIMSAFLSGGSLMSFIVGKAPDITANYSDRIITCGWMLLALTLFFAGLGTFTEEGG